MRLVSVRLLVNDFGACFRFYRDVLGLEAAFGDQNSSYAYFQTGTDVGLELFGQRDMAEAIGATEASGTGPTGDQAVVSFLVDDVDESVKQLEAKGIRFIAPPTDRPTWEVRTAHFRDPDGHLIEIYHRLSRAA